jgi:hypothetical protein
MMKKNYLLLLLLLIVTSFMSCSSNDEQTEYIKKDRQTESSVYAFTFDFSNIETKLKEGDSTQVAIYPEYISGSKLYNTKTFKTRATSTPMVGKITDLGRKMVTFKRNHGENLVPSYFTRQFALCQVWKISLRIDYPDENTSIRGLKGEFTGWKGDFIGNTQERFQGSSGNSESVEFYTYVYKLISDIYGINTGDNLYLPVKPEEARIYVRFSNI